MQWVRAINDYRRRDELFSGVGERPVDHHRLSAFSGLRRTAHKSKTMPMGTAFNMSNEKAPMSVAGGKGR
jgi:hypothetical protein